MKRFTFKFRDRRIGFTWNQLLGFVEKPYLRRWVLDLHWFSIRLHHWMSSDDPRAPHDHNWGFMTFVFWGRYFDHNARWREMDGRHWRISTIDRVQAPAIRFRPRYHKHWVEIEKGKTCWSLMVTGPFRQPFGFWTTHDRWMKASKYFHKHGHHAPPGFDKPRKAYLKNAEGLYAPPERKCTHCRWSYPKPCSPPNQDHAILMCGHPHSAHGHDIFYSCLSMRHQNGECKPHAKFYLPSPSASATDRE